MAGLFRLAVCGLALAVAVSLVKPSLIFAALWTALLTFREVSLALFLAGPRNQVLSVGVWLAWEGGNIGPAAAGAVAMVAVIGLLLLVILAFTGGQFMEHRRGLFSGPGQGVAR